MDCILCEDERGRHVSPVVPGEMVLVCHKHIKQLRANDWTWTLRSVGEYETSGETVDLAALVQPHGAGGQPAQSA